MSTVKKLKLAMNNVCLEWMETQIQVLRATQAPIHGTESKNKPLSSWDIYRNDSFDIRWLLNKITFGRMDSKYIEELKEVSDYDGSWIVDMNDVPIVFDKRPMSFNPLRNLTKESHIDFVFRVESLANFKPILIKEGVYAGRRVFWELSTQKSWNLSGWTISSCSLTLNLLEPDAPNPPKRYIGS
jgi:hypothetical protein